MKKNNLSKYLIIVFLIFVLLIFSIFCVKKFNTNFSNSKKLVNVTNISPLNSNIKNSNKSIIKNVSNNSTSKNSITKNSNYSCEIFKKEVIVKGASLEPLIKDGQTVEALFGYYKCHSIKRNDVVLYNYTGRKELLIKIVKAVPGDKWSLRKINNSYNIIVNKRVLKNSLGKPYTIPINNAKMLLLYVKSYPVIPKDTYLILGNKVEGTIDSTKFGLVDISNIVAKVKH